MHKLPGLQENDLKLEIRLHICSRKVKMAIKLLHFIRKLISGAKHVSVDVTLFRPLSTVPSLFP